MCRAELEQAHGRLRVVHRTRPARALHVGNVLPGGSGWAEGRVAIVRLMGGRPRNESTMSLAELREAVDALGGIRASAEKIGCHLSTVANYFNGERAVPAPTAAVLRELASAATAA